MFWFLSLKVHIQRYMACFSGFSVSKSYLREMMFCVLAVCLKEFCHHYMFWLTGFFSVSKSGDYYYMFCLSASLL